MTQNIKNPEQKMQSALDRLGIPLKVCWVPKPNIDKHGELASNLLLIYDQNEADAWETFEHEIYEWRFKEVTFSYRTVINCLIGAIEKLTYERKENFLEFLPRVSEIIKEVRSMDNRKEE